MKAANYLTFKKGEASGPMGKVGGLPTVSPSAVPWSRGDNPYIAFILELRSDELCPGTSFIQLYQPSDAGDDPLPIAIVIKPGEKGGNIEINSHPQLGHFAIGSELRHEPDTLPPTTLTLESGSFFQSKIGGNDPWEEDAGNVFLGQISEEPAGFNFGGMMCSLYLGHDGSVIVRLN